MKILVIEDDQDLRKQLCGLLADKDYETLEAKDEAEAEKILNEYQNGISIAIVDMVLPSKEKNLEIKESGLRIIQFMTEKYPEIISIVYTGHESFRNVMKCIEAGASYYLVKGDEIKLFLKIVERASNTWSQYQKYKRVDSIYKNLQSLVEILDKIGPRTDEIREVTDKIKDEIKYIRGEQNE